MLDRLRRDESGFTLIELLAGIMVGMIVLFAAFALMDVTNKSRKQTELRVEAVQRGRTALEDITRQLRSQTCLGTGLAPVISAQPQRVEFYASLDAPTQTGVLPIEKRVLEYVPTSGGRGRIRELVYEPAAGSPPPPDTVWATSPASTRTVVDGITLVSGTPLFRYWKYDATYSPDVVELTGPALVADRALIVRIDVTFDSFPEANDDSKLKTVYEGQVFVRTADPTDPTRSPKCI